MLISASPRSVRALLASTALAAALAVLLVTSGCASTSSTSSSSPSRSDVIGVWEYQASGSRAFLDRGVFKIVMTRNGRLEGVLRDSRLGQVDLDDVRIRNGQMYLRIQYQAGFTATSSSLQISGRVKDDKYTATYSQPMWDVTTSQNHRRQDRSLSGSIFARRVQQGVAGHLDPALGGCGELVESGYRCR